MKSYTRTSSLGIRHLDIVRRKSALLYILSAAGIKN